MTGTDDPAGRPAARELAAELRAPLPDGLDRLDDEALHRLMRDLRAGKARRVADIDAAIDASLALLPRHFRPAVRRVLGL
ncbi:MAG: hypothetical protein ACTHMS_13825 [Jatrophihabitans sp.]|uniref:hypothetical protein n=1 Tax=Jatrophihabitans sp. TaxID=1932789 RepID=UPI003F818106